LGLRKLEHFLVLTKDIERTKDFYCDALGLIQGPRPELEFPGYWVYLGDIPAVHIADHESYIEWTRKVGIPISSGPPGTGALDHIAFNAEDFDAVWQSLKAKGYELSHNILSDIGLKQIFLADPNGLVIELNFRE
jgi:catechol 2,3-dioxygenase-like lactoylglutathione lyase family enzyme